jgi:hypothetical protein
MKCFVIRKDLKMTTSAVIGDNFSKDVGFEFLMAVSTKMAVFWVVALYSLVEVYQRFRRPLPPSSGR